MFSTESPVSVLFVSMPFGPLLQPSLALALLKQVSPVSTEVLYLTLSFAKRIGAELYEWIAEGNPDSTALVGEWLFSSALFGRPVTEKSAYLGQVLRGPQHEGEPVPEERIRALLRVREDVDNFLGECVELVLARKPTIVGFTTVFQQNTASLALAKRIKARSPDTSIVFGGSNCESPMGAELARRFPFVDAFVSGEAELVLPDLVGRLLEGRSVAALPGVYTNSTPARDALQTNAPPVRDMDALPIPDYTDYFEQWRRAGLTGSGPPRILFETSRGCWWGEKQHCTFCGLNGANMAFRSKSPDRALRELGEFARRHPGARVLVVDNILDMKYFEDYIPRVAEYGLQLFYEVKANLKKHHVRLLRDAGITLIQPGIESLSDAVLEIMRKGVSGLQNIQLLKWCQELGVRPLWNFIWGFSGEPPEEYERMADLVPLLTHLTPPKFGIPLRLDRFSPSFERAAELGFVDVAPAPAYHHVYPFPRESLMRLAYFFDYEHADGRNVSAYTHRLRERIAAWQAQHEGSALFYLDKGDQLVVCDFRPNAARPLSAVSGVQRAVLLECDGICSLSHLNRVAEQYDGVRRGLAAMEGIVEPLVQHGYLIRSDNRFLSLVLPSESAAEQKRAAEVDARCDSASA